MNDLIPQPVLSALSEEERRFLLRVFKEDCVLRHTTPGPAIQSLIDRGYCRTVKARSGPLGIYTGELFLRLTEAGEQVLRSGT